MLCVSSVVVGPLAGIVVAAVLVVALVTAMVVVCCGRYVYRSINKC